MVNYNNICVKGALCHIKFESPKKPFDNTLYSYNVSCRQYNWFYCKTQAGNFQSEFYWAKTYEDYIKFKI